MIIKICWAFMITTGFCSALLEMQITRGLNLLCAVRNKTQWAEATLLLGELVNYDLYCFAFFKSSQ